MFYILLYALVRKALNGLMRKTTLVLRVLLSFEEIKNLSIGVPMLFHLFSSIYRTKLHDKAVGGKLSPLSRLHDT